MDGAERRGAGNHGQIASETAASCYSPSPTRIPALPFCHVTLRGHPSRRPIRVPFARSGRVPGLIAESSACATPAGRLARLASPEFLVAQPGQIARLVPPLFVSCVVSFPQ
jgi:hypothetical protein